MLIGIESFFGDKLLFGRHMSIRELRAAVRKLTETVDARDFASVFCARYHYEEIPYSDDIRVDYVIDLDICRLIKPRYGT